MVSTAVFMALAGAFLMAYTMSYASWLGLLAWRAVLTPTFIAVAPLVAGVGVLVAAVFI